MTEPAKPIQFQLRTLLLVTAAASVVLGLLATPENAGALAFLCASGTMILLGDLVQRRFWLAIVGCIIVAIAVPVHRELNRPAPLIASAATAHVFIGSTAAAERQEVNSRRWIAAQPPVMMRRCDLSRASGDTLA